MDKDQKALIDWRNGRVPISVRFDDLYFSIDDGLAETRHVFLAGNDLPARFGSAFQVAELGFGTGLNFLVTWLAWEEAGRPGSLRFTSFEAFPLAAADMARALAAFPASRDHAQKLVGAWADGPGPYDLDGVTLDVVIGDAQSRVADWANSADAWYLDGFSPVKNPDMWQIDLLRSVATHTRAGGTLASYTAAGQVRRDLATVGFEVTRAAGYGRKRHMTRARMPG